MTLKADQKRLDAYLKDRYLIKMNNELDRLQKTLFGFVTVYDEELKEYRIETKPLIENADAIVAKVRADIYNYTKQNYPDLF